MESTTIAALDAAESGAAVLKFIYCLGIAGLGLFVHMATQEGMMLRRYYLRLVLLWRQSKNPNKVDRNVGKALRLILKPLGLCPYCLNGWLFIAAYSSTFGLNNLAFIWFGIFWLVSTGTLKAYGSE